MLLASTLELLSRRVEEIDRINHKLNTVHKTDRHQMSILNQMPEYLRNRIIEEVLSCQNDEEKAIQDIASFFRHAPYAATQFFQDFNKLVNGLRLNVDALANKKAP